MSLRIDLHQHLWSAPLVAALTRRSSGPRITRDGRLWRLAVPGEADCTIDVEGDDVIRRAGLVHLDGLDRALVALSAPLGVEGLAREEAQPLLDAYHAGVAALPPSFGFWGAISFDEPDAADVDAVLDAGAVGLCIPAGAIASPGNLEACGPLLERLEARGAPLFVHPGADPWAVPAPIDAAPGWWPAMTDYLFGLQSAWYAFVDRGRAAHPTLRVVFAALAGGAPLHLERLGARGGPVGRVLDRNLFYETSSYGPRALDALVRTVGIDQLVHGSDRPVVAPPSPPGPLGRAAWEAMVRHNTARLLRAPSLRAVPA